MKVVSCDFCGWAVLSGACSLGGLFCGLIRRFAGLLGGLTCRMMEPSTGEAAAVTPITVSTRMCSSAKSSISAMPEVIAAKGAAPRADCRWANGQWEGGGGGSSARRRCAAGLQCLLQCLGRSVRKVHNASGSARCVGALTKGFGALEGFSLRGSYAFRVNFGSASGSFT